MLQHLRDDGQAMLDAAQNTNWLKDTAQGDHSLHTLKGAATTLGLTSVGTQAQALREKASIGLADVQELIALLAQSSLDADTAVKPVVVKMRPEIHGASQQASPAS